MSEFTHQLKLDLVAALIEFFGTMLFLLMGLGGIQAASVSKLAGRSSDSDTTNAVASIENLLYISTSMGLSLLATAWTFFRVSGSVFNPNVAIALVLTGAIKPMRFILYVCAEVLGAIVASALLQAALPGKLAVNCTLGPGVTHGQAIVVEGFLTAALTLTVLLVAVEKHRSTPFAPCAIGLVLFATHLFGVVFTGAALNSARAFGPALLTGFTNYQWVYWVGPSIGALVATAVYYVLKAVDLYSLTPKQDSDQIDDSPDLMGIEVKMRRRNSFGSTAGSGSHMGMSSTKKFRDGAPRHHHHPAYPRMGPPPFIPNPEYMHRGPYEAPHDYYQTFSPRSAGGHPAEKTHRAHFENNPIKLAYPKRSSHLSSGEESSQGYQHQLQQHQLSGKLAYPKRSSQVSLGEEKSQGYQHHLQQQQTSGKLASNSKADYPPRSSEELKEIPIWSPYSVIPLQPGLGTHYHR